MKRLIITLAAAVLALSAANAEEKTKTYNFGDITGISAGGIYQIHVTEGKSDKVKVVYDDDIEEYVKLEVRYFSGTLTLTTKQDKPFKNWSRNSEIHVYVEMDRVEEISLSGAAKATFDGSYKTDKLDVDLSGATNLNDLFIEGHALDVDLSGASTAEITGNFANKVEVDISGASRLSLTGNSRILESDITGASSLFCAGSFDTCEVSCSGASKAELKGDVSEAEYECSGASTIDAEEFHAKFVDVDLTGASKAKVYAKEKLHHYVSRGSKMTYYGDAALFNMNEDRNVVKGN